MRIRFGIRRINTYFAGLMALLTLGLPSLGRSHRSGQVLISQSCAEPVFLCDGVGMNPVSLFFALHNMNNQTDPNIVVDSIVMRGDSAFINYPNYPAGVIQLGDAYLHGPLYAPTVIGQDTLWITVYYEGDSSSSFFPCVAMPSPDIGLLGFTPYYCPFNGGGFSSYRIEFHSDTLHDRMNGGNPYVADGSSQRLGDNRYIVLTACGGAILDSISLADNFSEFTFLDMPHFPDTLTAGGRLLLDYQIVPSIVGKHRRPLVFHLHGGGIIVWSFEYEVVPPSDVAERGGSSGLLLSSYPNPLASRATIVYTLPRAEHVSLKIFDILGHEIATLADENFEAGPHEVEWNAGDAVPGVYYCRVATEDGVQTRALVLTKESSR